MLIVPGSEDLWDIRGFHKGVVPIVQKFADAGIPAIPVETWYDGITRRDEWHPDANEDTLTTTAQFTALAAITVASSGALRRLRTG